MNYFDAKREIKTIYGLGVKAIRRKDTKYINFLISNLDKLKITIDTANVNNFGKYVIKKDIRNISKWLNRSLA